MIYLIYFFEKVITLYLITVDYTREDDSEASQCPRSVYASSTNRFWQKLGGPAGRVALNPLFPRARNPHGNQRRISFFNHRLHWSPRRFILDLPTMIIDFFLSSRISMQREREKSEQYDTIEVRKLREE